LLGRRVAEQNDTRSSAPAARLNHDGYEPPLLALDNAGVEELLEVAADRRLFEAQQGLEAADAHGLAVGTGIDRVCRGGDLVGYRPHSKEVCALLEDRGS
jgi:hypothetical protein